MEYFLGVVVFLYILLATVQDLKRREVDNWLNFSLLCFGIVFVVYNSLFYEGLTFLRNGLIIVGIGFFLQYAFYYGRVFAGGDAKLLFAMSPLFTHPILFESIMLYIVFIFLMLLAGGIYGLLYSLVLYVMHFKACNKRISYHFKRTQGVYIVILGVVISLLSFITYPILLLLGTLCVLFPLFVGFAKGVEEVVMVRNVRGSELREGDWLVRDVKVGRKLIKASFEGVSKEEMKLLRTAKRVVIKDGLPFVPAFLFGFILYIFYSSEILMFLSRIFG